MLIACFEAFAAKVQKQLSSKTNPKELIAEFETAIQSFPPGFGSYGVQNYEELDSNGTALWNLCTRLKRECNHEDSSTQQILLLLARVYAFYLLDCAQSGERGTIPNIIRLFKIGLKAAKGCIGRRRVLCERRHHILTL